MHKKHSTHIFSDMAKKIVIVLNTVCNSREDIVIHSFVVFKLHSKMCLSLTFKKHSLCMHMCVYVYKFTNICLLEQVLFPRIALIFSKIDETNNFSI